MAQPIPGFYTTGDVLDPTHDFGEAQAGEYSTGKIWRLYNAKGSTESLTMTSVKITARDDDGGSDETWVQQHWIQIKSNGCSSGSTGVMTDDAQTVYTAVGKNKELSIGNIPSDKYRTLHVRCYPPTDAEKNASIEFQLRATCQQPQSSICNWITGLRGNGVVASTGDSLAMSTGSTGSEIDYESGYALIYNNEVYFGSSGTHDISTTGSGTYSIYMTESGTFGETTGSVASNQLLLYEATISSGTCEVPLTDKRVYLAGIQSGTTGAMSTTPNLGEIYLDITNGQIYGAKVAGTWTHLVPDHNDLGSLDSGDYLHLTATEDAGLNAVEQTIATTTGTANINWATSRNAYFVRSTGSNGAVTFTFGVPNISADLQLVVVASSAGSTGAIVWPTINWKAGTEPTLSTGANSIDRVGFYHSTGAGKYLGEGFYNYSTV